MRKPILVFLLTLLSLPATAWAQDAAKVAKIEELFRLTKVDQMQQQMLAQMKSMVASQFEKLNIPAKDQPDIREFQDHLFSMIAERMSWDRMRGAYVKLYDDTFTDDEISGIIAFYKTPTGSAMLEKMPTLMSKAIGLAQQQMGDLLPEVKRSVEEFGAKHKK